MPHIIFINHTRVTFQHREQTGRSLKEHALVPLDHVLGFDPHKQHGQDDCGCERHGRHEELKIIENDDKVLIEDGQHFWSLAPAHHDVITVTINRKPYEFSDHRQTGRSLKERAGIALADVLFRDRPKEDEVIPDEAKVTLECGDCFHSAPPANYGGTSLAASDVGFERFNTKVQPNGWTYLIVPDYPLPEGLSLKSVQLLLKLPPAFPDAAPDMFWLSPHIRTPSGGVPQGTSVETLLGTPWQQFSWHLQPGAWRPGISTLRDFMRCIRVRLEKRN